MSYDIRYSLINTFKSIDQWRSNVLTNMGSALTPGFKVIRTEFGHNVSVQNTGTPHSATSNAGSRPGVQTAVGHLYVARTQVRLEDTVTNRLREGKLENGATDLSIAGSANTFFAVAESTVPGSRVFLTRGGDFHWKLEKGPGGEQRYRLQTSNGLYVLRNVDFDSQSMTVSDNSALKKADVTKADDYKKLLDFFTKLGWPKSTQNNYLAQFDKTPQQTTAWADFIKKFVDPGLITADAHQTTNPADPNNPIINTDDFLDPGVMRDAILGSDGNTTSNHTVDDEAKCGSDLRGLVLPGSGNENQYTSKGPSHIALVKVADASFLQTSSYGSAIYEVPKVYRQGLQVSNNQRVMNETANVSPFNVTERGIRVVGHMLEMPNTSEIISQMNQEQEVTNFVYKNLSQMLTDYNKSVDDLLGLIK